MSEDRMSNNTHERGHFEDPYYFTQVRAEGSETIKQFLYLHRHKELHHSGEPISFMSEGQPDRVGSFSLVPHEAWDGYHRLLFVDKGPDKDHYRVSEFVLFRTSGKNYTITKIEQSDGSRVLASELEIARVHGLMQWVVNNELNKRFLLRLAMGGNEKFD